MAEITEEVALAAIGRANNATVTNIEGVFTGYSSDELGIVNPSSADKVKNLYSVVDNELPTNDLYEGVLLFTDLSQYLSFASTVSWDNINYEGTAVLSLNTGLNRVDVSTLGTVRWLEIRDIGNTVLTRLNFREAEGTTVIDTVGSNDATLTGWSAEEVLAGGGAWLKSDSLLPPIAQGLSVPANFSMTIDAASNFNPDFTNGYTLLFLLKLDTPATYTGKYLFNRENGLDDSDKLSIYSAGTNKLSIGAYTTGSAPIGTDVDIVDLTDIPVVSAEGIHLLAVRIKPTGVDAAKGFMQGYPNNESTDWGAYAGFTASMDTVWYNDSDGGTAQVSGTIISDAVCRSLSDAEILTLQEGIILEKLNLYNTLTKSNIETFECWQMQEGSFSVNGSDVVNRGLLGNWDRKVTGGLIVDTPANQLIDLRSSVNAL